MPTVTPNGRGPVRDIVLAAVLAVVCGAVVWSASALKSGGFEPLGPGALPIGLAVLIVIFGVFVVLRERPVYPAFTVDRRVWLSLGTILAGLVFTGLLHLLPGNFGLLSFLFLMVSMFALSRFDMRKLPFIAGLSAATALGTWFIFTHVLVVGLP